MGTLSANRLGAIALIIGPILGLVFWFLTPGYGFVDQARPGDAQAIIVALMTNGTWAHVCGFLTLLGILLFGYGLLNVNSSIQSGGNGDAFSKFGTYLVVVAITLFAVSNSMLHVLASNAQTAAGAVYAVSNGIDGIGGIIFGLAILCTNLAMSARDDFNKLLSYAGVLTALVLIVAVILGGLSDGAEAAMELVEGICFLIITVWAVAIGASRLKA